MKQDKNLDDVPENMQSDTDPLGSWTGVPDDPYEVPVQDADDI